MIDYYSIEGTQSEKMKKKQREKVKRENSKRKFGEKVEEEVQ